ncbi:MAG: LLM class F420-dependent oxidoreductase [Pseudomonadales bacterium]|nr:LLM class F420-dependent oxidoreductase [Pseudomonadales bacterium]
MKLAVEFPSVSYREGPQGVIKLAQAVEQIGFDQLDMFDHVVMGYPTETRRAPIYSPKMPIMEALMTLSFVAAATKDIGLGTEVLILPQRSPTLTAKQVSTLDTLSGGRVRLGVGVGWQEAEYDALGISFSSRGKRMDEAIKLLRRYWGDERVDANSEFYQFEAIAMEPKPPQGADLPIWVGGHSARALRRVGELGDGWLGTSFLSGKQLVQAKQKIIEHAEKAGRDPSKLGFQMMLDGPPKDAEGKRFYSNLDLVVATAAENHKLGFEWLTVNMTAIFQSGARSIDAQIDALAEIHDAIRRELG